MAIIRAMKPSTMRAGAQQHETPAGVDVAPLEPPTKSADPKALRRCLGRWPTGVAVITTCSPAGVAYGVTVNSFASVSLEPPLVLWSLARTSQSFEAFVQCTTFTVNVLASDQAAIARRFAISGGDKFAQLSLLCGAHAAPRLAGCTAWLECETQSVSDGGDHVVMIGRVSDFAVEPRSALLFIEGELRTIGGHTAGEKRNRPSAGIIIVGNEILRAPASDQNARYMTQRLTERGICVREIRIVEDEIYALAGAIEGMRCAYDWVFVAGGLGPTHDDVTAAAVARALRRPLLHHPDAVRLLADYHAPEPIPESRRSVTRMPEGCHVLPDLIGGAGGFQVDNVVVLPGVPTVAHRMFEHALARLLGGTPVVESALRAELLETEIELELRQIQLRFPTVQIGCYPYFAAARASVNIILRAEDAAVLDACREEVRATLDAALARRS